MSDPIAPLTPAPSSPAVAPTQTATPQIAATQQGAGTVADEVTGDFETFLTLLTAQLRNQDPLNPADSTEFVAQLASFSGVEQQVATNEKLDQLIGALSDETAAGLANWIGLEVNVAAQAVYDGTPLSLTLDPVATADRADLVVRDETGAIVARQPIDPTQQQVTWSGEGARAPIASGVFSFTVESFAANTLVDTRPAQRFTAVSEVRVDQGQILLALADGRVVADDAVRAVRPAS